MGKRCWGGRSRRRPEPPCPPPLLPGGSGRSRPRLQPLPPSMAMSAGGWVMERKERREERAARLRWEGEVLSESPKSQDGCPPSSWGVLGSPHSPVRMRGAAEGAGAGWRLLLSQRVHEEPRRSLATGAGGCVTPVPHPSPTAQPRLFWIFWAVPVLGMV